MHFAVILNHDRNCSIVAADERPIRKPLYYLQAYSFLRTDLKERAIAGIQRGKRYYVSLIRNSSRPESCDCFLSISKRVSRAE